MKCCKTGALRVVNSSGGRDRELRDVPKALHNAEQLPRLNPSRAVPRNLSLKDLWVGKIPWRREQLSTLVLWPGESHRQRTLAGYSPWDH